MAKYDVGIRCSHLITCELKNSKTLSDYFIGIEKSKITMVAPWLDQKNSCEKFYDLSNHVVIPGLINGHTHLPMSLFRGLADDLPFQEWLHDYILPLEMKLVDEEFVRVGTELSALELIRFGVTTSCDMYFFEDVVGEVLDEFGLRALVAQSFMDFPTPDKKQDPLNEEKILERMVKKFASHERIYPCIAAHAPYSCNDDTLKKVRSLREKYDLPLTIHVAETEAEVKESLEKCGMSPVERLAKQEILPKAIIAHGVHLTDDDLELIKEARAGIIHNPQSNMKLGVGTAPVAHYIKKGVTVGLGTDGAASNNNLNMIEEMDTCAKLQKLHFKSNTAVTAQTVLQMATVKGAEALGLEKYVGSIEVGKLADIVAVDLNYPHLNPIHDLQSHLVYSATGLEVSHVFCHGKILFENGRYTKADADAIYQKARTWRDRMKKSK